MENLELNEPTFEIPDYGITKLKFRFGSSKLNIKAWCSFIVNDWLYVNNIQIRQIEDKLFVFYPKSTNNKSKIVRPIPGNNQDYFESLLIREFKKWQELIRRKQD